MIPGIVAGGAAAAGAGPALWTLANLANPPASWFNETSPVTGTTNAAQWNDITGNGNHLTQGSAGAQPAIVAAGLAGKRTLLFDGSDDVMRFAAPTFANATGGWVAALVSRSALDVSAVGRLLCFVPVSTNQGNSRLSLALAQTSANRLGAAARRLDGDSAGLLAGDTIVDTGWHMVLLIVDWANGDGFLHFDGNAPASNTSLTSNGSTSNTAPATTGCVGAATSGAGAIISMSNMGLAELALGFGALPTALEVPKMFGSWCHKWGIASRLPAGHPYKAAPPTV